MDDLSYKWSRVKKNLHSPPTVQWCFFLFLMTPQLPDPELQVIGSLSLAVWAICPSWKPMVTGPNFESSDSHPDCSLIFPILCVTCWWICHWCYPYLVQGPCTQLCIFERKEVTAGLLKSFGSFKFWRRSTYLRLPIGVYEYMNSDTQLKIKYSSKSSQKEIKSWSCDAEDVLPEPPASSSHFAEQAGSKSEQRMFFHRKVSGPVSFQEQFHSQLFGVISFNGHWISCHQF